MLTTKQNLNLGFNFLQVSTVYRTLLEKEMNKFDLHYSQISVLYLLWQNNGLSQIEIAKQLQLSQPTINKMIKSLTKNEFVFCSKCSNDGRIMRVFLTDKGMNIKNIVIDSASNLQKKFFSVLSETEQLILQQILKKMQSYSNT